MKTKDLYFVIYWDAYEDEMYQVEKAFLSKPLLINYLNRRHHFDSKKEIVNFIDFDDVYQIDECVNTYVEKVPYTYNEPQQLVNQFIYVLIEDFDDYCNSLRAFASEDLCCEYLDKQGIKYTRSEIGISIHNKYSNYRIETGRLYK